MTNSKSGTGMRYEDLVRLIVDRDQWRIMAVRLPEEDAT